MAKYSCIFFYTLLQISVFACIYSLLFLPLCEDYPQKKMLKKTKVIVLYTQKYNDSSRIVQAYSENGGRMAFWLRTSKNRKSMAKSMLFQPLSLLELEIDVPVRGSLSYIREAKPLHLFTTLPYDPVKLSLSLFLSEVLSVVLREEAENKPLFSFLHYSVVWLDCNGESSANFHLVFLMRLSRFLGLYPNVEDYRPGDYFDLVNGCFVSQEPFHRRFVRPDEAAHICTLMRMSFRTMRLFSLNREQRNRLLELLLEYYAVHLPGVSDLKSLPVLRMLFD